MLEHVIVIQMLLAKSATDAKKTIMALNLVVVAIHVNVRLPQIVLNVMIIQVNVDVSQV